MLVLQVALVSVCLLAGAVHGQEDKNFDIKKLLELYKTAKKGGFNFEKVNFDAVSSLSQIIKWQKYNNIINSYKRARNKVVNGQPIQI